MLVLCQLTLRFSPDAAGRRIGSAEIRECALDLQQLSEHLVVGRVRDCRTVENVVLVSRAVQRRAQLGGPLMRFARRLLYVLPDGWGCWALFLILRPACCHSTSSLPGCVR